MRTRRLIALFSLSLISIAGLFSQPVWFPVTGPTIGTVGPLTIPINYGIDRPGTVYIAVYNTFVPSMLTPDVVKSIALGGPSGGRVATAVLSVNAGNINTLLQWVAEVINVNTQHTIFMVAESIPGGLQAISTRLYATTLPCPKINVLTGFLQDQPCVNIGADVEFQFLIPNPATSGILKGTQWYFDWGDGTIVNYVSTSNNDVPWSLFTHTYTSITDCNYIFSNTIRNPCGELRSVQYIAVVHGRDIPSDGDGVLRLVNNATGSSLIQICEGAQATITIRDNSTWNCQNPTLPGGFTAIPNLEPRNIEWLYGREPGGATRNTITGTVTITTLGNAPQASGRISPDPYGPNSLSEAITIPATCKAGEYFRVYLKNWNKCNWPDPEFVNTYVDILVIAAPPAPTVANKTICSGGNRTLTVTSPVVGTMYWYSNPGLTTQVATGTSYTQSATAPGIYNYWVVDRALTGLQCQSPPTQVSLVIREPLTQPGVITGPANSCPNVNGLVFSVAADPPVMPFGGATEYVWSVPSGLTIASGQGTRQITVNVGTTTGNKTISVYTRYTTAPTCNSSSRSTTLTVYSTAHNAGAIGGLNVCAASTVNVTNVTSATTGTPASSGPVYSWERSPGPAFTVWTPLTGSAATFSEVMATPGIYRYRRTATFGCGTPVSTTRDITVYSTTINAGTIGGANICAGGTVTITNTTAASTGTPASAGPTYSWDRAPGPAFNTWTALTGSGDTFSETMSTSGTYRYRRTASYGCGTPATATRDIIVNPLPTPVITGNQYPCLNYTETYTTPTVAGHTYSWSVTNGNIVGPSTNNTVTVNWNIAAGAATVAVTETITATGCSFTTPNFVIVVNPSAPGAAGPISGLTNVCYGQTGVTYSIAAVANASNYTWSVPAGVSIVSGQGTTSIVVDFAPGAASPRTISVLPSNGCGNGTASSINVNIYAQLTPGTIGSNQSVCYNTAPAAFSNVTAPSGGTALTYQWQKSPAGLNTWTNVTGGTGLTCTDPDLLTASTDYRRATTSGAGCGTVYSNIVTVTVYGQLNGGTIGSNQSICYNTAPAAFTNSTSPSGGTGLTYQWQKSPAGLNTWTNVTGGTGLTCTDPDLLTSNTDYRRATISASGCGTAYSNIVTVTVYGQLTPGSIGSNQSICYNTAPALFTNVTSPSGGTGLTYQWQKSPAGLNTWSSVTGGTGLTCTDPDLLTANTDYRRATISTSGCGTVYSNIITVTVYGQLTPGSIGSNQSICYNTSPAAFTSVTNPSGGTGLTYQWQKSPAGLGTWTNVTGGTGLTSTDPDLLTANTDYRRATISASGCGTVYSNIVTVTVYGQLTPGSIGSNQSICYNTAPAPFTNATSPSGGTGLTYQWQKSPAGLGTWTNVTGGTGLTCTDPDLLTVNTDYRRATISASGCGTVYSNIVTVTIKQLPAITPGQNPTICSGNAISYQILLTNFTNPGDNVTFTWPDPTHSPGISGGTARPVGSSANITDTYTNTSGGIGTVTYAVTPLRDGCVGPTVNVVVNVGSEPVLDPNLNNFACSASPVGLILKEAVGSVVPSHYYIISRSVAAGLNADAGNVLVPNTTAPANYVTNDRFTNLTGVNLNVTYRVQPVLAPDCFGDPVDVVITIRPQPVIQPGQIKTVCSGVVIGKEILLLPANTPAGTVFNWNAPLLSDLSVQGTAGVDVPAGLSGTLHINDQINNFSIAPITATYTVTPTSSFGCVGTAVPVIITINPEPIPQPISGRDKICVTDKNIVYNVNPVAGSTFTWTVDPTVGMKTFDFNTNAILIDAAAAPGTGNITVFETNSFGCPGDPSTLPVQVYTQATPEDIAGPVSVCANSTHTYSVTNRVGSVYNWTLPGGAAIIGNPSLNSITVIYGNVGGTILVRETNAAGCVTNHNPLAVTVNPLPTAQISGTTTICEGGSGTLSVNFNGTAPYNFTYAINGVAQTPVSTSADPYTLNVTVPGNYTIVNVTDATNCTNVGIGSGSVTYYPKPTGVISGTTELCNGNSTSLTMTFTGTAPYTFIYTDGTTQVTVNNHPTAIYTISVSPVISTTYTLVSLTDGNGCTGVVSGLAVITVNDPPAVALTGTNLTCYNDNTGAVALTATGNGPFGYSWTGPDLFSSNSEDISGLKAGLYVVVVTDTKGCSTTSNITLTQPAAVSGSIVTQTNVLCYGGNNGNVTIAGSGGVGPYLFRLDAGVFQPSGTFSTLSAGTYTVTIQDANLCTSTVNVVITQPGSPVTVTTTQVNVLCNANSTGSATATASGGTGPYSYSWNTLPVQTTATASNLAAGNYTVTVTDNNGCTTTANVTITEPTALTLSATQVDVLCYGNSTGSATVIPTGGTGTYSYSWNSVPVQTTATANNLAAGTYTVTVRDGNNCIATINVTIAEPLAPLTLTTVKTDVTCNGSTTGSATVTPAGGTAPYTYAWNSVPAQTTATANNLAAGIYTVIVTDSHGCTATTNVTITQPSALTVTTTQVNVLCNGNSTGSATATAAGGTGPYSYSWNTLPVQATATASNLAAGNYTVTVTDNNGCNTTANVTITEPTALSLTTTQVNVLCYGNSTGSATVIPTGGTGTYTYSWNTVPVQTTVTASNLAAGTYTVTVRDGNNCIATANVTIAEPLAPLTLTTVKTDVTCNGASTGSATVTPAGGTAPYTYAWNSVPAQTTATASNLAAGTYTVIVTDSHGCSVTTNVTIVQPAGLTVSTTQVNVLCYGNVTGSATATASGGTGPYSYSWNTLPVQATATASNLSAGNYTVTVTDNNGCITTTNVTITQPAAPLAISTNQVNVLCFGGATGTATAIPSGGTGPYTYSWNTTPAQTTATAANLIAGTYQVTVTDNNGCIETANVTITEPLAPILAILTKTDILCYGNSTGSATAAPAGGTAPYSYSWNSVPVQTASTAINLPAGTYTVTIRDANNCTITENVTLLQPASPLTLTTTKTNVDCNGNSTGSATVNPAGGTGPYTYSWSTVPEQTTATASNLLAGSYTVVVTDNNGCTATTSVIITQPSVLTVSASTVNVLCNGNSTGSATATASGGTAPYTYSWDTSPVQITATASNLAAGNYTVTVTDNNGCQTVASVTITEPTLLTLTTVQTNVFCNGNTTGSASVIPSGGAAPYTYSWNTLPAQTTPTATNLAAGTYMATVTDNNGCIATINVTITEPPALTLDLAKVDILCNGSATGSATATITGGNTPYFYNWYSNAAMTLPIGQFTATAVNLAAGTYYVKVNDLNGCVISGNITILQPPALNASITSQTNVLCFGGQNGSFTVTADPATGTGPFEYSIDGGGTWQATGAFTNLVASVYTVFVRDANGCTRTVTVTLTQPSQLIASVTNVTNVSCFGNSNGSVTIAATIGSGTSPYSYSKDGGANWQPAGTFTGLTAGPYTFTVRDANGCTLDLPATVTEPAILELTPTPDVTLNCFGDKTGTGTFYAIGGTLPYTFSVTNNATASIPAPGFNTQSFFAAGVGSVTVQVTDSKGCTAQATITLTEPAVLTPGTIGNNQVLCTGDNPAELVSLTAPTGGPAAPSFQWQFAVDLAGPYMPITGAISASYTPAAGATMTLYYRRMVTSGMCPPVYSNTVVITVNPRPVAILSGGASICPGDNAILKVNLPVGTGPFILDIENYPGITITGYVSDADISVSPLVTTTYRLLRVRDANGCEIIAPSTNLLGTATVTVRALPAITVQPVDKITCEYGMVTYNVTATGTDLTYQWYVDDGGGFDPVIDGGIYFGSQTSTLYLFGTSRLMDGIRYRVDITGCANTVQSSIVNLTVNTAPEIIVQPKDSTICQGQNASFSIIAQGDALSYLWQVNRGAGFVDVANDANFSGYNQSTLTLTNVPGNFNNYIFRVRVSGTCGAPMYSNFVFLRVNMPPTVTLSPVNRPVCENGGPVYFTGNGSGMIDSLRWQVFTGGVWSDIYDNAVYSGTTSQQLTLINVPLSYNGYQYRLALKAFCASSYTNPATLTVNANPVVEFLAPVNACGGVPIVLNGNPSGGSGSYNQHTWTGDVGPLSNYFTQYPTFNSQIAGSYFLNYKVRDTNGCMANDTLQVIVDAPDATFAQDLTLGCTPLTVTFTKDMTGLPKFWWDFGDGSPVDSLNASPSHIFTNILPGSIEYREVELKVRSAGGCYDTFNSTVTVYPEIDASFTPSTLVVCSGKTITFTSTPGASKYFWEYGDGASGYAANVSTHLYTNLTTDPLVLTVRLTTTSYYNCTSIETVNITVMPVPLPQFLAVPPTQTYIPSGNPVNFNNMTNAGTWTWSWRFGDGGTSTVQNPSHTYNGMGTYNVALTVTNGTCTDSVIHPVTILPIPPVANFDSIPSGCVPQQINIVNTSLNLTPGTTYFWDFGDGNTSTVKSPNYVYTTAGTYRITLIVTGPGGTDTKSQLIDVYSAPKAYFEITPTFVFVNDERVRYFNLSSNADYYIWEFGDGDTSHVKDPYHKYLEEGIYDVTLHAYSLNGCYDTYVLSPGVTVEPAGVLRFATVFTPNKEGPQDITSLPTGGEQVDQFFYPPIREKIVGYKLQIFNRWGTLIFESHDINIPWNGYYKGKLCKQGVYVWYVEGKYQNGQPFKQTGDITLLH